MQNLVITATDQATNSVELIAELAAGTAQLHTARANGSTRKRHFLADGTKERAEAEWIRVQRTGQDADAAEGIEAIAPRSMRSIAEESLMSVAAVRRVLVDLELTEAIEDAEEDELFELLVTGPAEA